MRTEIKFKVPASAFRTLEQLEAPELNDTLTRFLTKAAFKVQRNVTEKQIIRGGKGPAAGKRITSRSGELRRSIGGSRGT